MFHLAPPEERLDPDDAELVDVIHTAGRWIGMDGIVLESVEVLLFKLCLLSFATFEGW